MVRALSPQQQTSATYFIERLTPLTDPAAIEAKIAEIHLEPGRAAGPECGCSDCITQYGPRGEEIADAAPPSEISDIPKQE